MPTISTPRYRVAITPEVAQECLERSGYYCEACGGLLNIDDRTCYDLHHRKLRRFGDHTAVNLMVVHAKWGENCHNLTAYSIHLNIDRSRRLGHILYGYQNPATVPVIVAPDLRELRA